jgi:hypothetical protein
MNAKLEYIHHESPTGRKFLNYWDPACGNDICCQIIDGKLFKYEWDDEGNALPDRELSFIEFLNLVELANSK